MHQRLNPLPVRARPRHRAAARAVVLTAAAALVAAPATIGFAAESVVLKPSAEGWYRPLPNLPELPVDGPAVNPYPAGTLHVGATAGTEESRTYLALEAAALPSDASVTGGTLTLPVLTDSSSGTASPETAGLRLCPVDGQIKDGVEGQTGGAPAIDCSTAAKAVFHVATASTPPTFTVDLQPFAASLQGGAASFAVVPDTPAGSATSWHVAFPGRTYTGTGAKPITAELVVAEASETTAEEEPASPAPDSAGSADEPALGSVSTDIPGVPDQPGPLVVPPATAPVAAAQRGGQVAVAAVSPAGFRYPGIFLLPLMLLGAAFWIGRAFTRDFSEGPV